MVEKERLSGNLLRAMRGAKRRPATGDASHDSASQLNSPHKAEDDPKQVKDLAGSNADDASTQAAASNPLTSNMREALALRTAEMRAATRQLREQSATLRRRGAEIDRLRQTLMRLEAENTRLAEERQEELEGKQAELSSLLAAYDQFEQESDALLDELSQKNERLRAECKVQNKLSVL